MDWPVCGLVACGRPIERKVCSFARDPKLVSDVTIRGKAMAETFDVVIAGAGHNSLIVGSYLAKAGLKVCIAERKEKAGGSVATAEITGPGFKQDICSVSHAMLMANPMIRNDELELYSKFGLRYSHPEKMTAMIYDDGSVLEFWSDLDRTCASIAK